MEPAINDFGYGFADAIYLHKVGYISTGNRSRRPEMRQKGFLALRTNSRDLVKRIGRGDFLAAGAVSPDGKAVRLIPQALQKMQHRLVERQGKTVFTMLMKFFASGIAVRAF